MNPGDKGKESGAFTSVSIIQVYRMIRNSKTWCSRIVIFAMAFLMVATLPFVNANMQADAACSSGIMNNGTGGISINVNAAPYTDSRWSTYGAPYGTGGCTWFVGARVMQLTGKGSYNTQAPTTWYDSYGGSLGFSKGTSYPSGKAVIVYSNHVAILEKTEGNTAYISEGGSTYYSDQAHGYTVIRTMTKSQVTNGGFLGSGSFVGFVYLPNTGNDPTGYIDSVTSGTETVTVRGWAYDPDNKNSQIEVHVYIGGPAGTGEGHAIKANKAINDADRQNGLSSNCRYSETITTQKKGSQTVYIYAINASGTGGSNKLLGSRTVNIGSSKPVVSNVKVSNVTSAGYTVSCTVTDTGSGVNRVQFPTWTEKNGQDDLVSYWTTNSSISGTKSGNTYTFQVKTSAHNNEIGTYYTDVYAWDNAGNESGLASHLTITVPAKDTQAPTIKNAKVIKQTSDTVVIEADITDNVKVTHVQNLVLSSYGKYSESGMILDFSNSFAQEWVSSSKMRFTLKNKPITEKNYLRIAAADAEMNSTVILVPFTTKAADYLYMNIGEKKKESEIWKNVSTVSGGSWQDLSDYNGVLELNDGVFTALKAGKCTLAYANGHTGEVRGIVVVVTCGTHTWDAGKVTKAATTTAAGVKTYTCTICGATKTESIPKKADPAQQMGKDGTAVGPGASAAVAEKAIISMKTDTDPAGSKFAPLKLKSVKQTKKSVNIKWTKVSGATKYVIYGNKCGKTTKPKKLATVTGKTKTIKKVAGKKLKKGTYYKFIVVALDKNNKVVSTSKLIHAATKGGKVGNHKSVTVKKAVVNKAKKLKKGKSLRINAKAVKSKLKVKNHRKVFYESSNPAIATVSKSGKVKGVKKGTCYIYAYAQNGVSKKIKIKVN